MYIYVYIYIYPERERENCLMIIAIPKTELKW